MLKYIHAHRCLCTKCDPDFHDEMVSQAEQTARYQYEEDLSREARIELYEKALKEMREGANAAAYRTYKAEMNHSWKKSSCLRPDYDGPNPGERFKSPLLGVRIRMSSWSGLLVNTLPDSDSVQHNSFWFGDCGGNSRDGEIVEGINLSEWSDWCHFISFTFSFRLLLMLFVVGQLLSSHLLS